MSSTEIIDNILFYLRIGFSDIEHWHRAEFQNVLRDDADKILLFIDASDENQLSDVYRDLFEAPHNVRENVLSKYQAAFDFEERPQ